MTATTLTLPAAPALDTELLATVARRVLLLTLLVIGGLLTFYVLSQFGAVVYGLPAPFFRRAVSAAPAEAV